MRATIKRKTTTTTTTTNRGHYKRSELVRKHLATLAEQLEIPYHELLRQLQKKAMQDPEGNKVEPMRYHYKGISHEQRRETKRKS